MHAKFTALTPDLYEYLLAHNPPQDDALHALAEETAALGPISMMQIAVEQGAFLTFLAGLLDAKFAVEIGTFTGYSAISIARGLRPDGKLLTCDVSEEWTAVARRYFEEAGLAGRIELRLGPALDTIRALPREESFDLAFVDADKSSYADYYEEILARLRRGGLLVIDNVLWGGRVLEESPDSEATRSIRALNERLRDDHRIDLVMLPVADGVSLCRKR